MKIELPLIPRTFYCVGLNYLKHLKEAADKAGTVPNVPDRPEIGYRAQNALIAHDEDVVIPASATEKIHYEGELVVVIGKKAKHLTEANAMSCVFGYTIGNDVSERTWQKADRSLWRSKNADTFKPMGPWIETEVDLDKMETAIRVNGKETGRFHTNDMIFGVVPFIVELTKYFTLWPGDVIWMGTDGASPNLKAGDVVEIDITGIGTLRNRFVAEKVERRPVLNTKYRKQPHAKYPGSAECGFSKPLAAGRWSSRRKRLLRVRHRGANRDPGNRSEATLLDLDAGVLDDLAPAHLPRRRNSGRALSGGSATMTRPSLAPSFLNASDCTAFAADLLRRSMISGGVLAGA